MVNTSLKYKRRNKEQDSNAPDREDFEFIRVKGPEEIRKRLGLTTLTFPNIVEAMISSLRTHAIFMDNAVVDERTGLLGFDEFKDFMVILSLYEWRVNYPNLKMEEGITKTLKRILKKNSIAVPGEKTFGGEKP